MTTPDSKKQGCLEGFKAHKLKSLVSESLRGLAGGRKDMKFKRLSEYRARLLGHQHLETFLDGDSVSRVFVVWGEPSRMGRAGVLSRRVQFLQGIDPVPLFIEVILEKHDYTAAGSSKSVRRSV